MDIHRRTPSADVLQKKTSPMELPFGGGTTLDDLLGLRELTVGDNDGEDDEALLGLGVNSHGQTEDEDEHADFQLEPVEL